MNVCNTFPRLLQSRMKLSPSGSQLEKSKMKRMMLVTGIGRTGILIQSSTASNSCSGCHLTECIVFLAHMLILLFLGFTNAHGNHEKAQIYLRIRSVHATMNAINHCL